VHELHHRIVLLLCFLVLSDDVCTRVPHYMRLSGKMPGNGMLCRHDLLCAMLL
jgi:hypothetical protein